MSNQSTAPPELEESLMEIMWTTWEELLLTCAVKRHGQDWGCVAMELQNRSSQPLGLTAQICKDKYTELKRRYMDDNASGGGAPSADDDDSIPWLEDLRNLWVAELKQEVHRRDLSIKSLQLKVKRLEDERERDSIENDNDDKKSDLETDKKNERSENDKSDVDGAPPEVMPDSTTDKSDSGVNSDRDSRTLNESNSAENVEKSGDGEVEAAETAALKQVPEKKQVASDSCNDSSDTVAKHKPSEEKKTEDELRNSAAESKERSKENSDVQSSASLTKKIPRKGEVAAANIKGITPATMKRESAKTEPLSEFLDILRTHEHGSMFERRLDIQKTDNYRSTVRKHVDLETIQTRIDDGSYSSCPAKFYSDLLLLVNNVLIFFPKNSSESAAAIELRTVIVKGMMKKQIGRQVELKKIQPKPDPEKPDSLPAGNKSSASIIVCRKKSSISVKPSSSKNSDDKPISTPANKPDSKSDTKPSSNSKQPIKSSSNEEEKSLKLNGKEKPVTGARSMRRNGNCNRTSNSTTSNKNVSNTNASNKEEVAAPAKGEKKKKAEALPPAKKSGAADFLKRIKRNSPGKVRPESGKGSTEEGGSSKREQQKKKEVPAQKKKGGGGSVKHAKEDSSPSKKIMGRPPKRGGEVIPAKRGREVDGGGEENKKGSNSKRPAKRTRR